MASLTRPAGSFLPCFARAGSLAGRVSQAGRHPITPLSAKLTIDSESVRELINTTPLKKLEFFLALRLLLEIICGSAQCGYQTGNLVQLTGIM